MILFEVTDGFYRFTGRLINDEIDARPVIAETSYDCFSGFEGRQGFHMVAAAYFIELKYLKHNAAH